MIVQDIRVLLERLNPQCAKAVEDAVSSCISQRHYELTWEHVLLQLLDSPDNDIGLLLNHYRIPLEDMKKGVTADVEQLPTGNSAKPVFSPFLVTIMEQAWSLASLTYSLPSISSGTLFVAACQEAGRSVSAFAAQVRHLSIDTLKADLPGIIKSSVEQQGSENRPMAGDGADGPLQQFCTNFTQMAREGAIDTILGRDEEIRQVVDILGRRRKNNPILVGDAGVGKTAIVEGLALRVVEGDVPEFMKDVEVWGLDLGLLQAGAGVKGEFEKRLKNVIDVVKASAGSIVLFIDEAHTLIGAGGTEGQNDAANLLKPALARGELRTVAATTWAEYRRYFEKDPALARRFQLVRVDEPDEDTAITMLRGIAQSYERYHAVHISDEAVDAAVRLSHRYVSGRQLPDKAVDVLDTACTRVKMSQSVTPPDLDRTRRSLDVAQRALAALQRDVEAGIDIDQQQISELEERIQSLTEEEASLAQRWETEKEMSREIFELRQKGKDDPESSEAAAKKQAELEELQGQTPMVFSMVNGAVCARVIADWTSIPVGSMMQDEARTLLELEERLRERIVGQDAAISAVSSSIRAAKTGMRDPDKPLGIFLFAGPSGVGKTESALALADLLFGGEKFTTVINMSEYQERHTVSQLKGAPPGYAGYGEGGVLTEAVRRKPYSVVVLDEIEKAHQEVMNLFFQVFDKGFMRDGQGREVNFRNTLIILTSNLGSERIIELGAAAGATGEQLDLDTLTEAIRPDLYAQFPPALMARCTLVPFQVLDSGTIQKIVEMKLDRIAGRLGDVHSVKFDYAPEVIEHVGQRCVAVETGARNVEAVIESSLLPQISREMLGQLSAEGGLQYKNITVGLDDGERFSLQFA